MLLDEFEHRIDAMIDIAGGARPEASAPVSSPEPPAMAAPAEATAPPAEATAAPAEADHPPAAEMPTPQIPETATEADQVPTVSGVVSRLGPDHDAFNEAVVRALNSAEAAEDDRGPSVAMLKAMVEALSVETPAAATEPQARLETAELEVAEIKIAESEAQPAEAADAAPDFAYAAHDPVEPAATAEIQEPAPEPTAAAEVQEPTPESTAFAIEFAERPYEAAIQPSTEVSTPKFLEEAWSAGEPASIAEIQELATEPSATADVQEVATEPTAIAEVQETAPEFTAIAEVQETAPDVTAFAVEFAEPPVEADTRLAAEAAMQEVAEAAPADEHSRAMSWPGDAVVREGLLLASLQQMGPIPPQDEGTAVIFSVPAEPEPEPASEAAPAEPATPEPEHAATPPDPELARALADPDFDPTDFLFGPEIEFDPTVFLLDPAPQPPVHRPIALPDPEEPEETPAAAHDQPDRQPPHDPLHALKAMTPEEKIALFT